MEVLRTAVQRPGAHALAPGHAQRWAAAAGPAGCRVRARSGSRSARLPPQAPCPLAWAGGRGRLFFPNRQCVSWLLRFLISAFALRVLLILSQM